MDAATVEEVSGGVQGRVAGIVDILGHTVQLWVVKFRDAVSRQRWNGMNSGFDPTDSAA